MYTKASGKAVDKYVKAHYDRITIRFKKGEFDEIKAYLLSNNISVNSFVVAAVKEKYQNISKS